MNEAIFIKKECIEKDILLKKIIASQNKIRNSLQEIEIGVGQVEWCNDGAGTELRIEVNMECLRKHCNEMKEYISELYRAYELLANRSSAEQPCD